MGNSSRHGRSLPKIAREIYNLYSRIKWNKLAKLREGFITTTIIDINNLNICRPLKKGIQRSMEGSNILLLVIERDNNRNSLQFIHLNTSLALNTPYTSMTFTSDYSNAFQFDFLFLISSYAHYL